MVQRRYRDVTLCSSRRLRPWLLPGLLLSLSLLIGMQPVAHALDQPVDQGDEAHLQAVFAQLTADEKIALVAGASSFSTAPVERLGLRQLNFADGANGVRSNNGDATTAFPVGLALAATWNIELVTEVGTAMGEEARALNQDVLLAPNLNLLRSPLSGRNFETYGEDPYLVGQLGSGFIRGVQRTGVAASAKHFVGNEQETERNRSNSVIDARALHELYLKPFQMVVADAHPWTVMTAYNRTNGVYMSEHSELLRGILKGEWRYDGLVMSDWGATHSTQAMNAGLDLEMPGPAFHFGEALRSALHYAQVPQSAVDDAALRMLRLNARVNARVNTRVSAGVAALSTPAHRSVARQAAAQAITLLKNDAAVLPLDRHALHKLAVIGPNADSVVIQGGGSAQVIPAQLISPLDGIRALLPASVQVLHVAGVSNEPFTPVIDGRDLSTTLDRKQMGLHAQYWPNGRFAGPPMKVRNESFLGGLFLNNAINLHSDGKLSAKWTGYYWPRVSGDYEFESEVLRVVEANMLLFDHPKSAARLWLNGKLLLDPGGTRILEPSATFFPTEMRRAPVHLEAGKPVRIAIDYAGEDLRLHPLRIAVRLPTSHIAAAVQAAREADVAIVFVGSGSTAEAEGRDRNQFNLSGEQDALVQAVAAANPKTIVVLHNGAPVAMPWVDQVPAIVEAWLPGQEGNLALADVLFGLVNPSGKLPVTFPKQLQDTPSYPFYPGFNQAVYGESIFMGYRWYDKKDLAPLFAFGHGLSYTTFAYDHLEAPSRLSADQPMHVSVQVTNTGTRAGSEVVQWYVSDAHCLDMCPVRELKGFARVELQPGETRTVSTTLDAQALMHFDAQANRWHASPGKFVIAAGSSARDLRLAQEVELQ